MYIKLCTHDRIFIGKTEMKIYGKWYRTIWKRISIIGEKIGPHVWLKRPNCSVYNEKYGQK
jgi:hypothetical protein